MAAGQLNGLCASAPDGGDSPSTVGLDKLGLLGMNGEVARRQVLGAALALPLLPLEGGGWEGVAVGLGDAPASQSSTSEATPTPTLPPRGGGSRWRDALAAYLAAEAAVEEAGRLCAAASRADIHAAEDAYGDRLEALYGALRRMLVVPAPGIGAFLVKVDAAFEHELHSVRERGERRGGPGGRSAAGGGGPDGLASPDEPALRSLAHHRPMDLRDPRSFALGGSGRDRDRPSRRLLRVAAGLPARNRKGPLLVARDHGGAGAAVRAGGAKAGRLVAGVRARLCDCRPPAAFGGFRGPYSRRRYALDGQPALPVVAQRAARSSGSA